MIRNKENKMETFFLRTDVRSDDSNIYVVIEKVIDKERPFLIQNLSKKIKLDLKDFNVLLHPKMDDTEIIDPDS